MNYLEAVRIEVKRDMFLRMLQRQFGELDEATTDRVSSASEPQVEEWFAKFFDAEELGDILER